MNIRRLPLVLAAVLGLSAPAHAVVRVPHPVMRGIASWYGPGFHGRTTSSGVRFDMNGNSAAHRSLPFGTRVLVTNLNNGRSVVVVILDRGPFVGGRVLDVSRGAARLLGAEASGVFPVELVVLPTT